MKIEYHKFESLKEITLKYKSTYYVFTDQHLIKAEYGFDGVNNEYIKLTFDLDKIYDFENIKDILETDRITLNIAIQYNSTVEYISYQYTERTVVARYKVKINED